MDIKDQVANLELSKRLKALEIEQESIFYWTEYDTFGGTAGATSLGKPEIRIKAELSHVKGYPPIASAFTTAELGMMFPDNLVSSGMDEGKWSCIYGPKEDGNDMPDSEWEHKANYEFGYICMTDDNEADVRAKMLIYLIENDLIKIEKDNDGN